MTGGITSVHLKHFKDLVLKEPCEEVKKRISPKKDINFTNLYSAKRIVNTKSQNKHEWERLGMKSGWTTCVSLDQANERTVFVSTLEAHDQRTADGRGDLGVERLRLCGGGAAHKTGVWAVLSVLCFSTHNKISIDIVLENRKHLLDVLFALKKIENGSWTRM